MEVGVEMELASFWAEPNKCPGRDVVLRLRGESLGRIFKRADAAVQPSPLLKG